jgi:ADP-ribosylglycohydrolase
MCHRRLSRRSFFQASLLLPAAATLHSARAAQQGSVSLRDKFFGCIAGCHIGSSMGAAVEGWPYERIEKEYGTLDRLLPYQHYRNGWTREPGTTEDGVERQKLMITAIIEKQDRVTAEDVRRIWLRDIKPESAGMVSEPFEAVLLAMARTGIPATDLGRYCDYAGLVSMARSCHPIGLINAGDPGGAIEDVYEVGQLYQTANSRGLHWASVTAAAIAAATRPGATVESVIDAIFQKCDKGVVREIERGLKLTVACTDFREMRKAFDPVYSGTGIPYAQSYANEVVTKALCILRHCRRGRDFRGAHRILFPARGTRAAGRSSHEPEPLHELAAHAARTLRRVVSGLQSAPATNERLRGRDGCRLTDPRASPTIDLTTHSKSSGSGCFIFRNVQHKNPLGRPVVAAGERNRKGFRNDQDSLRSLSSCAGRGKPRRGLMLECRSVYPR